MKKVALKVFVLASFFLILTPITPLVLNQLFSTVFAPMENSEEEWENKNITWYYENLLYEDRRKIRLAMDYAIPRQKIIDEIYVGFAEMITTPIGKNMVGIFDQDITARPYNTSMSLILLTEVFGKTFNQEIQNETFTTTNYFRMTIVSPTTNAARSQWTALIAQSFRDIGIDTTVKWWNWNIIVPRLFDDPVGTGYDYAHGGYDAFFMDYSASADPDYSSKFLRNAFVPKGDNYAWIDNSPVEDIWDRALKSSDSKTRIQALHDFQQWFYDQVPMSIICQELDIFAIDPKLEGFDTYLVGRGPCFNNCTIVNQITMTYTIPGDFVDFNPLLSNNYYDSVVAGNIFLSLTAKRGEYNLTHPVPLLAKSWESSADGLEWVVTLRKGVQWHDGTEVTADDVVFSYQSFLEEELESPKLSFIQDRFGKDGSASIKKLNTYTVKFTLQSFYPYVTTAVFGLPIIQKAQMEQISFTDWKTHNTNQGTEKLIGCGPYEFEKYDIDSVVILVKSDNYNQARMGHNPTAIGGGIFWPNASIETIYVSIIKEDYAAIGGLEKGSYDAVDPQTGIHGFLSEINSSWVKVITTLKYGWQELVYNQYSPIWGMNPGSPYEMYWYRHIPNPDEYMPTLLAYFLFFISGVIILVVVILRAFIQLNERAI